MGNEEGRRKRTHSQPPGQAAWSDCAHTPEEWGPNAAKARTVAIVAQSRFEFMTRRDKEEGTEPAVRLDLPGRLSGGEMPRSPPSNGP